MFNILFILVDLCARYVAIKNVTIINVDLIQIFRVLFNKKYIKYAKDIHYCIIINY